MNRPRPSPGRPLRILFVAVDLSTGGGVNRVIRDLAALFRRRFSADVTVVNARGGGPTTYDLPADVAVQSHGRQPLLAYFVLLCRLRRSAPDFVISSWTQDNILVTLAFLWSRSKVVLVEHSPWHLHGFAIRLLRRLVYPLASVVVVLNRHDLQHYRPHLANVRLIPDPVSLPAVTADPREKLILAVGHASPIKQLDHAVRAMALSGLEQQGWSLVIIAAGSELERLHELIGELGLERTRIQSPEQELGSWYSRASLLLVTSRVESFSLVLAEGMLAGVVPVAYASDGPSYILEDFPRHLVKIDDVNGLANRMIEFANDDLNRLREDLRASVERRFSPELIAEQWAEVLA